jgi:hypothetical protein
MSKLEQALAEADEIEAAGGTTDPDAPLPDHIKVTRPGRARSKVLQVRLNPEEMAALEAIAERRNLPVSTVAREQILRLLREDANTPEDSLNRLLRSRISEIVSEVLRVQLLPTVSEAVRTQLGPRTGTVA